MNAHPSIQSIAFSGHESFPLRFAWPTKAVRNCTHDPAIFNKPDAVVQLGVGKNMVRSMRHWAYRAGLIEPIGNDRRGGQYGATELGTLVFGDDGEDPYMEDPATSWLIHWQLCAHARRSPTTWLYVFNGLREPSFTVDEVVDALWRVGEEAGAKKLSRNTIERDVKCLVRSYTSAEADRKISQEDTYDSPLVDLGLLYREPKSDRLVLDRSARPTLPVGIVAFAVASFWSGTADSLSFEQLAYADGSPGQVFKLSENALVEYLEQLYDATSGNYAFDYTAGLRQVFRRKVTEPLSILRNYYANSREIANAS
ncbi:MAG: DUF4007 family protein [Phycisphaeraceae bacterium]|nr:DUF4007 family protein [Phycisphaeraceae bacterium]